MEGGGSGEEGRGEFANENSALNNARSRTGNAQCCDCRIERTQTVLSHAPNSIHLASLNVMLDIAGRSISHLIKLQGMHSTEIF